MAGFVAIKKPPLGGRGGIFKPLNADGRGWVYDFVAEIVVLKNIEQKKQNYPNHINKVPVNF